MLNGREFQLSTDDAEASASTSASATRPSMVVEVRPTYRSCVLAIV